MYRLPHIDRELIWSMPTSQTGQLRSLSALREPRVPIETLNALCTRGASNACAQPTRADSRLNFSLNVLTAGLEAQLVWRKHICCICSGRLSPLRRPREVV